MSFLGIGRRHASPVPAYAASRSGHDGWWAVALDDDRVLAGPFRNVARAGEVADAISAGKPWRWEAGD